MISQRAKYKLLSAVASVRDTEKDMPDEVSSALEAVEKAVNADSKESTSDGDEKDDKSFDGAGKRAAEKFRQNDE